MLNFYTPLKTSENLRFSDVFNAYRGGTLVKNGLNKFLVYLRILLTNPLLAEQTQNKFGKNPLFTSKNSVKARKVKIIKQVNVYSFCVFISNQNKNIK